MAKTTALRSMPTHEPRPSNSERLILLGGSPALLLVILASRTISLVLSYREGAMVSLWTANGHAAGDVALLTVAERLKSSVRKTDLLARIGGDEFVVLCRDIDSADTAEALASKIEQAMQEPMMIDGQPLKVTLSIGLALYRDAPSADALAQLADQALYDAKAHGRACHRMISSGV